MFIRKQVLINSIIIALSIGSVTSVAMFSFIKLPQGAPHGLSFGAAAGLASQEVAAQSMMSMFPANQALGKDKKEAADKNQARGQAVVQNTIATPPGGLSLAVDPKVEKEKIDAVNTQLKQFDFLLGRSQFRYGNCWFHNNDWELEAETHEIGPNACKEKENWENAKKIISDAVRSEHINPDRIVICGYTPTSRAIVYNDLEFLDFLFRHGANPNNRIGVEEYSSPILSRVISVKMAEKFLQYGASIELNGLACLQAQMKSESHSENVALTRWYLLRGVDVNASLNGETALTSLATRLPWAWRHCSPITVSEQSQKVEDLMAAGAKLTSHSSSYEYNRFTVPQVLKKLIERLRFKPEEDWYQNDKNYYALLQEVRSKLLAASRYRHALPAQLKQHLEPYLISALSSLVCEYNIGALEKTYEELEAEPYPGSQQPQAAMAAPVAQQAPMANNEGDNAKD